VRKTSFALFECMSRICDLSPFPKLVKTDIILSLHHHLNTIFKMIKFILLALLCFTLSDQISAKFQEDKVGHDGYRLEAKFDDETCCKDTKKKDASPEVVQVCLDSKNSKKIADAVIAVIQKASMIGQSYEVVKALRIPEFMVSKITYQEWAENIEHITYNFEGFSKLQQLVTKYVLCKKVCKVFFHLRDALRQHAATADLDEVPLTDTTSEIAVTGDLIVLGDIRKDIEHAFLAPPAGKTYTQVRFSCDTLIIDANLLDTNGWAGINIVIDCDNVIVPKRSAWYVDGNAGS
jgi:hypothetical protein